MTDPAPRSGPGRPADPRGSSSRRHEASLDDGARWDARYREADGPAEPVDLVVATVRGTSGGSGDRGRALDIAGGSGRNAVWLAAEGYDVTVVDVSAEGLAIARRRSEAACTQLSTVCRDLERDGLPPGRWDLVVMTNFWNRAVLEAGIGALEPGGIAIFGQPTVVNHQRHPHPRPEFLVEPGEIAAFVATLDVDVIRCDEAWRDDDRHTVELVVRRPAAD